METATKQTSASLVKSIYERAAAANKTAWVSEKQEAYIWSLLYAEGRVDKGSGKQYIATILPTGEWRTDLTHGEAIKIGSDLLKRVYMVKPPHYIRREGFQAKKIIII